VLVAHPTTDDKLEFHLDKHYALVQCEWDIVLNGGTQNLTVVEVLYTG